ncbi:MAG: GNAT family N-acetyltransferase [Bacteroidota bacterium]
MPLFFYDWWLDAVCGEGNWAVAIARDRGGEITGVLPHYRTRRWGVPMILLPPLTPYLGVWLRYPANVQKRERRYAFEQKTMGVLLQQIPHWPFVVHHHPPSVQNGLPFYWAGFHNRSFYTYSFPTGSEPTQIWRGMKSSVRNKIEKATRQLRLRESDEAAIFYQLNRQSFSRQGLTIPYSWAFFQNLDRVLAQRGRRTILLAEAEGGQVHAGIYLVEDQHTRYNLALGGDTDLRKSGAIQLLLWRGIRGALERGLAFDFEGSMIPAVEGVFRDFGAERKGYLRTERTKNRFWRLLRAWRK